MDYGLPVSSNKVFIMRPLTFKRAAEVAFQIFDIFLLFGAPVILLSDNDSEFTAAFIKEFKELWPKFTLLSGKPRHQQSQGFVERAKSERRDMLIISLDDRHHTT